jgi:hypothetical protein
MMDEKQAAAWRKKREMGKSKYVAIYGMLTWGLLLGFVFSLLEFVTQGVVHWGWVCVRLVVFGFIGFFIANHKWNKAELKLTKHDRSPDN